MHHLVQHYKDNLKAYNADYFLGFVLRSGDRQESAIPKWRKTKAAKELSKMITISERPFDKILEHHYELKSEDLDFLLENMPSGWQRAKFQEISENIKE